MTHHSFDSFVLPLHLLDGTKQPELVEGITANARGLDQMFFRGPFQPRIKEWFIYDPWADLSPSWHINFFETLKNLAFGKSKYVLPEYHIFRLIA